MKRKRIQTALLAALVVSGVLSGCGSPGERAVEELRAALDRTSVLSRRFVYQDAELGAAPIVVKGVVEDDVRHQARVEVDRAPAMDSVTRDDALAVRFFDRGLLEGMTRQQSLSDGATSATLDALRAGQWVLDPTGHPVFFEGPVEDRSFGVDPVSDAQQVFDYVHDVIREMALMRFNEDAIEYRPEDDPFPVPSAESGVTRYDFVRPPLPSAADPGSPTGRTVFGAEHFRKMAVYVRGGLVTRILEEIDVEGMLDDFSEKYGIDFVGSPGDRVEAAVALINQLRATVGDLGELRVRKMSFDLFEVGRRQHVELPSEAIGGDLSVLIGRGRAPRGAESP